MITKIISGGQTGVELTSRGTKRKYLITVRDPKRLDAKRIALQDMEQERRDCQVIGFTRDLVMMNPKAVIKKYFQPVQIYLSI